MKINNEVTDRWPYQVGGIDDDLFIRGDVPMTKSEVRAVTLSKLRLVPGMDFLDIGAGTGSISIEAALAGCKVTALERNELGLKLIHENAKAFGVTNMTVIQGLAPMDLPKQETYHRVFIGGTGGKMEGIFDYLEDHLREGGIIVANTVTIENSGKFLQVLKDHGYQLIEVSQVQVSRSKPVGPLHMMMAENPITIISACKGGYKENQNGKS